MRLDKFLFCFELELGGIIIGFYHLIMNCLAIISAIVAFVLALIYGELKIDISSATNHDLWVSGEDINLILMVVGLIAALVIALFLLYISWQLIMGMEHVRLFKTCANFGFDFKELLTARSQESSKVQNRLLHWIISKHFDCYRSFDTNWKVQPQQSSNHFLDRVFNYFIHYTNLHFYRRRLNFQEVQGRRISNKLYAISTTLV